MASLTKVAEAAGVSRATASLVLNRSKGWERISPECTIRVETAASKLRYRTNYHMQAVRRGRANVIGLATEMGRPPDQSRGVGWAWWNCLRDGAEGAAHDNEFDLLTIHPHAEHTAIERAMRFVSEQRVDAVVTPFLAGSAVPPDFPIVIFESNSKIPFAVVGFDEAGGIRLALDHLRGLGHRDLLWFGPGPDCYQSVGPAREQLFISMAWEMVLRGRSCCVQNVSCNSEESFLAHIEETAVGYLAAHPRGYTAVVAFNDHHAIGMCRALIRAGVRVPQDVSVIGFDDIQAYLAFPPLTTIDHRLYDIGYRACEVAIEMALGKEEAVSRLKTLKEKITPKLVVRESTGPVAEIQGGR